MNCIKYLGFSSSSAPPLPEFSYNVSFKMVSDSMIVPFTSAVVLNHEAFFPALFGRSLYSCCLEKIINYIVAILFENSSFLVMWLLLGLVYMFAF